MRRLTFAWAKVWKRGDQKQVGPPNGDMSSGPFRIFRRLGGGTHAEA